MKLKITAWTLLLCLNSSLVFAMDSEASQQLEKRHGIVNGHAAYLWLKPEQKIELSAALDDNMAPTSEDKIRHFDTLLQRMKDERALAQIETLGQAETPRELNDPELEKRYGVINGHPGYLWLKPEQKVELFKVFNDVTAPTPQDKIRHFDTLLQRMEDERALAQVETPQELNDPELEERYGVISGHPDYLWLKPEQKVELSKVFNDVTAPTPQDKIHRFDTLLQRMKDERTLTQIETPQELNDPELEKRYGFISGGHAGYLWLKPEQKVELSKVFNDVTAPTPQDKIHRFDTLLQEMEAQR